MRSTYSVQCAKRIESARTCLYDAAQNEHHFCHHPHITAYKDRLYAMWSNGKQGEGEIGQRVLYTVSEDGETWAKPCVLLENMQGSAGPLTLVAAGWLAQKDMLIAYIGAFNYAFPERRQTDGSGQWRLGVKCINTQLMAMTSADGTTWSSPINQEIPICPNMGPQRIGNGKLLIAGNWAHAVSYNASGLGPWHLTSFCDDQAAYPVPIRDDPFAFWEVSRAMGIHGSMCEGAFIETEDGKLHMLHRSYGNRLYESISCDAGESWCFPVKADFPDGNSKFFLGRLPDGRYLYIGNPGPDNSRCPLVLSLSQDGSTFDSHYLLEDEPVQRKFPGVFKNGMYAYPHAVVQGDYLYVIYSLWKEDVYVQKIPLGAL